MLTMTHKTTVLCGWIVCAGFLFCLQAGNAANQTEEDMLKGRMNSLSQLRRLGNALIIYSESHSGKYPDTLAVFKSYNGIDADWLIKNVCYIGTGMTKDSPPDKPIAFDKTLLSKENGTAVLFNDEHVEFVPHKKLATLVIPLDMNICAAGSINLVDRTTDSNLILKVIGPDNQPLAGVRIYEHFEIHDGRRVGKEFIGDANGLVILAENKLFANEWEREGGILYGLFDNNLAGFMKVKAEDLGKEIEMKLTPVCHVHGTLKSTELTDLNMKLPWTIVYVFYDNDRPLAFMGGRGNFKFLLPAGKYKLLAYGTRTNQYYEDIEINDGQKDLEINFDLPADRLAYLIGKQAPELQQIKGWLNSKPIKLADLRGKVVLLDFWGTWCGPCVASIPELIDLNEKYHDKGLVIIGIHDDSMKSITDLEKEIGKLSKVRWDNKKIPFAVALDGGGSTKIEGTKMTTRGATTAAYGINSFPTMVLINRQGRVIDQFYPGAKNELLEKLLADKTDENP
jgi:thiol-disulfide isomerase/thioredoxin